MPNFIPTYLSRSRHGVYYFHYRIPKELKKAIGTDRSLFRRSLKTKDKRVAASLARHWWCKMDSLLDKIKKPQEFKEKCDRAFAASEEWKKIISVAEIRNLSFDQVEELMPDEIGGDFTNPDETEFWDPVGWAKETLQQIKESEGTPTFEHVMGILNGNISTSHPQRTNDEQKQGPIFSEALKEFINEKRNEMDAKHFEHRVTLLDHFKERWSPKTGQGVKVG